MEGKKLPKKLRTRKVLFGELADDYLEYAKANNEGWKADKDRIATLKAAFGNRPSTIEIADLREWFNEQGWKPATYNRWRTVLRSIFKLAIENKKAEANPVRLFSLRKLAMDQSAF